MRTVFRYRKSRVVKFRGGRDNDPMNLFLALFWLTCTVMLLVYELTIGPTRYRMIHFSWAGGMLLLMLYNLKRWRQMRSYRLKRRAEAIARANEERERRRIMTSAITPDPNFNFTDEPAPPPDRGITDRPRSNP